MALEMPKSSRAKLIEKMELLEVQKTEAETDLSKLNIAAGIRYTENDVMSWLKQFCKGDLFDMDFRKRITDTFINSVWLYDDKLVIYYNIRDGKQVSYIEMLDSTKEPPNDEADGSPENSLSSGASGVRILNGVLH